MHKKKLIELLVVIQLLQLLIACGGSESSAFTYTGSGQSGSLTSMATFNGQLHVIDKHNIQSFSLDQTPLSPYPVEGKDSLQIIGAETLFNYDERYLMVGTRTGITVLELNQDNENSNNQLLNKVSEFNHIRSYDPVIAFNDKAYYTTRDGNSQFQSSLDRVGLLDISDIENPIELTSYQEVTEPFGLGLYGTDLYVCDKTLGLIKLSIEVIADDNSQSDSEQTTPIFIRKELNIHVPCNDLIVSNDRLILTSELGIIQLQIKGDDLEELSRIDRIY